MRVDKQLDAKGLACPM